MPIWIALIAAVVGAAAVLFTLRAIRQRLAQRALMDAFAMLEATTGGRREASTLTVAHPSGEVIELWVPLEPRATPRVQIAVRLGRRESAPLTGYRSQAQPRAIDGRPHLRLRRETWRDRLSKGLRIGRELRTGDAEFDREVYVDSDAPDEDIHAILGDRRIRDAARLSLARGFSEVEIGGKRNHLAAWSRSPRPEHLVPGTISALSDALAAAAPCLPHFSSARARTPPRAERARLVMSVLAGTSILFLLIALFLFNRSESFECVPLDAEASNAGWGVGLGVTLVVTAIATWLVRGACLLLWIPMSGRLSFVLLNGILDGSTPSAHRVRVLQNEHRTGKVVGRSHVRVESWRRHERYLDLNLPAVSSYDFSFYNDVSIVTRPGAFGWECIDSVKPLLGPGQRLQTSPPPDGSAR